MARITLEELPCAVGLDLGSTDWLQITQDRIDDFADVTEDRQWIHTDLIRAASGPFGTPIAHGYLTLSLVSFFLLDLLVVSDATSVVNYGLDRVRFPAPVPAGSRIRGHGTILSVADVDRGVQSTVRLTVECDAASKPVAVADVLTRFYRQ